MWLFLYGLFYSISSIYFIYSLDAKIMNLEKQLKAQIQQNLYLQQEIVLRKSLFCPLPPVENLDSIICPWYQKIFNDPSLPIVTGILLACIIHYSNCSELGVNNNLSPLVEVIPPKAQFVQMENWAFNLDLVISMLLNTYREFTLLLFENSVYSALGFVLSLFVILFFRFICVVLVGWIRNNSKYIW